MNAPGEAVKWQWYPRDLTASQAMVVGLGVLVLGLVMLAGVFDATVLLAAPAALVMAILAIVRPFTAFVIFLCMLSLVPIESHLFQVYIPNWTQSLAPLLLLGAVLYALRRPHHRGLPLHAADIFLLLFLLIGFIGIKTQPGPSSLKYFANQQVLPAMFYFIAKWLPLDRARFHLQLRWQLLSVMGLSAIMVGRTITGFDPFYHGFRWLGLGGEAIGPMGSISDTVAYVAIFPILFLYAIHVRLPQHGGRPAQRLWWAGLVLAMLATLATTERTGLLAMVSSFAVALILPRLARPVLIMALLLPLLVPVWMFSPVGNKVSQRLATLKEEGAGFERHIYRDKAILYTRQPYWNPLVGTGFGRISTLSAGVVPPGQWFYDYNWQEFRPLEHFAARETHCAPVTVFAEYDYGGVAALLGLAALVGVALGRGTRQARRAGRRADHALIITTLGALATVMANGLFHNTETVVPTLILLWSFAGVAVGHPEVFALAPEETPVSPAQRQERVD